MKLVSVCQNGHPVTFYYREAPQSRHTEHAVEQLLSAINSRPNRLENPLLQDEAAGVFEARLELAQEGKLEYPEHVKRIRGSEVDLFEIRWSTIPVQDTDPVTGLFGESYEVHVRLYYLETGQAWVVGLHCHEKDLGGGEAHQRMSQNLEIQAATRVATDLASVAWRVPELSHLAVELPDNPH